MQPHPRLPAQDRQVHFALAADLPGDVEKRCGASHGETPGVALAASFQPRLKHSSNDCAAPYR